MTMKKIKYMKRLVLYFTEHSLFQNLCRLSLFSVWFWLHLVPTVQSKVCSSQTVLRIWIQPDLYLFVGSGPYEGFDQNVRIRIPVQIQPKILLIIFNIFNTTIWPVLRIYCRTKSGQIQIFCQIRSTKPDQDLDNNPPDPQNCNLK